MEIISITDNYSVSGELNRDTIEKLVNLGFVRLINVRPDGEAQGQMSSREYARKKLLIPLSHKKCHKRQFQLNQGQH